MKEVAIRHYEINPVLDVAGEDRRRLTVRKFDRVRSYLLKTYGESNRKLVNPLPSSIGDFDVKDYFNFYIQGGNVTLIAIDTVKKFRHIRLIHETSQGLEAMAKELKL